MEFHVRLDGARPDLDALGDAIREVDPSALLDIDSSGALLRVAAAVQAPELVALLGGAGSAVTRDQVRQLPSICCGGCSVGSACRRKKPSGCNPGLRQVGEAIEVQTAAFAMQLPQPRAEQGDVRLDRVQRFALPPWQQ